MLTMATLNNCAYQVYLYAVVAGQGLKISEVPGASTDHLTMAQA